MWAALTAIFVVLLILVVGSSIWLAGRLIGFLQPILIPVAIAAILAYLLDPLVTHLSERRMTRAKAIAVIFAIAFLAFAAMASWIIPTISIQSTSFARELPSYTNRARDKVVDLLYRYNQTFNTAGKKTKKDSAASTLVDWLFASRTPTPKSGDRSPELAATIQTEPSPAAEAARPPQELSSTERQRIQEWVERQLPNLERQIPTLADKAWLVIRKSVGGFLGISGFLLNLVMVPVYLFFLLKERPAIASRWKDYLPLRASPLKDEVAAVLAQVNNYIIAYFRGQLLVCLIDGFLIGTALLIFGLNFAPLIGILVVILTMIPYVGIVLCWIPAVLIAAAQWGDWTHVLVVTGIMFVIQNLEAIFVAPRIVGKSVGLHPMTVIVSIFVWGLLIGGLLGPILAIPLTATIKVLMARYVWGRRLGERVQEQLEEIPVVRAAEERVSA